MPRENHEKIQERERTTIDQAREQGIGEPTGGIDPAVPSYTDPGGVSDLGVDEPVVPGPLRGSPSPGSEENTGDDRDKRAGTIGPPH